jgi:hypothetical protein
MESLPVPVTEMPEKWTRALARLSDPRCSEWRGKRGCDPVTVSCIKA